jgi:CMP-N,N'-diacetyllegionaminic acid synthase
MDDGIIDEGETLLSITAALVVARAGSKSIPRKNIRPVAGKPLIAYTFEAAKASARLDRIFLSTDDLEVAALGREYGVEVPFMRPAELAGDTSPVIDATLHALAWLADHLQYKPDYLMLLQPTSPFRSSEDVDAAIRLAEMSDADAVVSVAPAAHHPYLLKTVAENGRLRPWVSSPLNTARRQDLPPVHIVNGAIYLVRRTVLLTQKTWCPETALAYVMPEERSMDIDTPWDLKVAEALLSSENRTVRLKS